MMFNVWFSDFILIFKLILESDIKNENFYLKNYEDNFDERYHQNYRLEVSYFEIILNQKSIIPLSKLSFH
jgi:hypothetical protein